MVSRAFTWDFFNGGGGSGGGGGGGGKFHSSFFLFLPFLFVYSFSLFSFYSHAILYSGVVRVGGLVKSNLAAS